MIHFTFTIRLPLGGRESRNCKAGFKMGFPGLVSGSGSLTLGRLLTGL